jgi:acyl-coenzyme A synthetase/AMP-(fatty) acid ligase
MAEPVPMHDVRVVNFAGAPFPLEVFDELRGLFPRARFFNNYGCTEAMPRIAIGQVQRKDQSPTIVGPSIDTIQVRIKGDQIGPVQFRGPSTALGTINDALVLESFPDWIDSGDDGKLDEEGNLHILGRHDQVLKVDGERISLVEIEQKLIGFGAKQAQAWKSDRAEHVIAAVRGLTKTDAAALRSFLRKELPRAAWPREVYILGTWPMLESGKTDRKLIQQQVAASALERLW